MKKIRGITLVCLLSLALSFVWNHGTLAQEPSYKQVNSSSVAPGDEDICYQMKTEYTPWIYHENLLVPYENVDEVKYSLTFEEYMTYMDLLEQTALEDPLPQPPVSKGDPNSLLKGTYTRTLSGRNHFQVYKRTGFTYLIAYEVKDGVWTELRRTLNHVAVEYENRKPGQLCPNSNLKQDD